MQKIKFILSIALLIISLTSCETAETRQKECTEVVQNFIANLSVENYDVLSKLYPDFQKIRQYRKAPSFTINSITEDEDKVVSIIGTSAQSSILFLLKKEENKYVIINSKGLSAEINTPLYKYCEKIGCFRLSNYDKDISQVCITKAMSFQQAVVRIKNQIEEGVNIENHNLQNNAGYIGGEVVISNSSRFSIPSRSYQIYIDFTDASGNKVFTEQGTNYGNIPYGQNKTQVIFISSTNSFKKVGVRLEVTDSYFIEDILAENASGNNCIDTSDL